MMSRIRRCLFVVGVTLMFPVVGNAQEASLSGTVTDSTGGVLPGVTVNALLVATGNTFFAVSDESGAYRIPLRIGTYRITADLPGFVTTARTVELLVGQQATLNLQMAPSGVQESITVTGEAPLVNTASSTLGSAVDSRQMESLPVNGRNFLDLAMLAPGNRNNAVSDAPVTGSPQFSRVTSFQLNVDGQQVTNVLTGGGTFGQPRYSRDAIAEFQFIANRFDATQGRSLGVQVNAVTKSGTNTRSGSVAAYFRDSKFSAEDFIQKRVLPYSDQQLSGTFGGPIRRDRIHFFVNYEYEREPQTYTYSSPYPQFNIDQPGTRVEQKSGARLDFQFSPQTRLSFRANAWSNLQPYDSRYTGGANRHPSGALVTDRQMRQAFGNVTHVVSNSAVNELKVGYAGFSWYTNPIVTNNGGAVAPPSILLRGYTIGLNYTLTPQTLTQTNWSVRNDFSFSFNKAGRHDLKVGGEVLPLRWDIYWCNICTGVLDATRGPIPANIQDLFPVWNDSTTWNLAPLSPIAVQYRIGVGDFSFKNPWNIYAAWVQDDWKVNDKLTVNLGARYDLQIGAFGETLGVSVLPFVPPGRRAEKNDIAPRLGAVYSLSDRTIIRGGYGKFFTQPANSFVHFLSNYSQQVIAPVFNDGRPDFASNPFNGPVPTYEQVIANACDINSRPGCLRREIRMFPPPSIRMPYSHQASIGVQRQFTETTALSVDYVVTAGRHDAFQQNVNMSYNATTGVNNPFTDISKRPYPDWAIVGPWVTEGYSDLRSLQAEVTKRFSRRWQASGTYTLSGFWDGTPQPVDVFREDCQYVTVLIEGRGFVCDVPVTVPKDLGGEYGLGVSDQRHRATVNAIWEAGYGFQLSGLYFFGSGERFPTTHGGDLRITGGSGENRLKPDGTIVPRNNFVGKPIHRVDLRLQRRFNVGGGTSIDGILEAYNVFNHANYGAYVTTESSANYGAPSAVQNVAYYPRTLQMGLRVAF